jgi:hypothetical protein
MARPFWDVSLYIIEVDSTYDFGMHKGINKWDNDKTVNSSVSPR